MVEDYTPLLDYLCYIMDGIGVRVYELNVIHGLSYHMVSWQPDIALEANLQVVPSHDRATYFPWSDRL